MISLMHLIYNKAKYSGVYHSILINNILIILILCWAKIVHCVRRLQCIPDRSFFNQRKCVALFFHLQL